MCNTYSTKTKGEINTETLRFLKQRYPWKIVRQVMPQLAGFTVRAMAKQLGKSQPQISQHIIMLKYRSNAELQENIARLIEVPREEFFERDGNHGPHE